MKCIAPRRSFGVELGAERVYDAAMGKHRAGLALAIAPLALASTAACGGGESGPSDAPVVIIPDAPPDGPPDAPPDARTYDLSCASTPFPTTAPATVTAAGTVQELGMSGVSAVAGATLATFQIGGEAAVDTATSDATGGFTTGALPTGGAPFDGYIRASKADAQNPYRHTFVFPPAPLAADLPLVPVLMLRASLFSLIASAVAGVNQNDAANGALMVFVTDCTSTPIPGSTVSVKRDGVAVGTVFDFSQVSPMAAGAYFVFNVPAGEVDVSASYEGTTFPAHRVISFANGGDVANGATTLTIARPGPL